MAREPVIVPPRLATRQRAGWKGVRLAKLGTLGEHVPKWFAVAPEAMVEVLQHSGFAGRIEAELDHIRLNPATVGDVARSIQQMFSASKVPLEMKYELSEAMTKHLERNGSFAVRSSPGGPESAPGLYESFLYQRDEDDVCRALLGVWASAFSEDALTRRLARGQELERPRMAVLVQDMVEARSSGLTQTIHTELGRLDELHLRALWGTGVGLTLGLQADTFRVPKKGGEDIAGIATKTQEMILNTNTGHGLMRSPVPETRHHMRSLSQEEVKALAEIGLRIEQAFGRPQQIRFTVDTQGQLFTLSTRPLRGIPEDGPAAGNEMHWGQSLLREGLSAPVSPLGFSLLRRIQHLSQLHLATELGTPWNTLVEHREALGQMLGRIQGRVFINLEQWQSYARLLPDDVVLPHDEFAGLPAPDALDPSPGLVREGWWERTILGPPRRFRARRRLKRASKALRRGVPRLIQEVRAQLAAWREQNLGSLRPHELMQRAGAIEALLIRTCTVPLVNEVEAMRGYSRLRHLCVAKCRDANATIQNDLLVGIGGYESLRSTEHLADLAATAHANDLLRDLLLSHPASELAQCQPDGAFPAFAGFPAFQDQLQELIRDCGDAVQSGPRIGGPILREDLAPLVAALKAYLHQKGPPVLHAMRERNEHTRREAELLVRDLVGPLSRFGFNKAITRARNAIRNTDRLRVMQEEVVGYLREVALALGAVFASEDLLDVPEDVFHLRLDELWDYIRGAATGTDLQGLVEVRRAESERHVEPPLPDPAFTTFGMVYHRNRWKGLAPEDARPNATQWQGTGCCPGSVEGEVVHAEGLELPETLYAGAGDGLILACTHAVPEWAPWLPVVEALLVEYASPLSPTVVLARELGIPTVVGIRRLGERLPTGTRVRVNGSDGTVERL